MCMLVLLPKGLTGWASRLMVPDDRVDFVFNYQAGHLQCGQHDTVRPSAPARSHRYLLASAQARCGLTRRTLVLGVVRGP